MRAIVGLAVTLVTIVATAPAGRAQLVADHLKCYKIRDLRPRKSYTADLDGLAPEPGCVIRLPGRLLCVAATKTNLNPPAQDPRSAGPAGRFVCYKVKCPKGAANSITWRDQFGTGAIVPSTARLLCAPELPPTTTTSTTTTYPSVTTSPSTTTTTSGGTSTTTCNGECAPGCGPCQNSICITAGGTFCGHLGVGDVCIDNGTGGCTVTGCSSDADCAPPQVCAVNGTGQHYCCSPCS